MPESKRRGRRRATGVKEHQRCQLAAESCTASLAPSMENRGTLLPRGAVQCTSIHAACARAIWPRKTAFHWAAAAGVKERWAKYWLAGEPVSGHGKLALIRELD